MISRLSDNGLAGCGTRTGRPPDPWPRSPSQPLTAANLQFGTLRSATSRRTLRMFQKASDSVLGLKKRTSTVYFTTSLQRQPCKVHSSHHDRHRNANGASDPCAAKRWRHYFWPLADFQLPHASPCGKVVPLVPVFIK